MPFEHIVEASASHYNVQQVLQFVAVKRTYLAISVRANVE
jgi:hypothetical protein